MPANSEEAYEAPVLRVEGSLLDLTHVLQNGDFTDKDFPIHTPKADLTFS